MRKDCTSLPWDGKGIERSVSMLPRLFEWFNPNASPVHVSVDVLGRHLGRLWL